MDYWLLLAAATLIISSLAWAIYLRTRDASLVLGIGILYYYSIFGAWFFVADCLGGQSSIRYWWIFHYIHARGELNADYFNSLVFYSCFIITVEIILLLRATPTTTASQTAKFHLHHYWLFIFSALAFLGSYYTVQEQLKFAVDNRLLVYHVTRGVHGFEANPLFTLHQLFNRLLIYPLFVGFAVLLSSRQARIYSTKAKKATLYACYFVAITAAFSYLTFLGNKNEMLVAVLGAVLVYIFNAYRPRTALIGIASLLVLGLVAAIDMFRLLRPGEYLQAFSDPEFLFLSLISLFRSNEAFAAHFSMYTSLYLEMPLTNGTSVINFPLGFIPSFIWPDRPNTIYEHYSMHAGISGLGFTIHHATGWYLNFGFLGVLIGASILGFVWSGLQRYGSKTANLVNSPLAYALATLGPLLFAAAMPIIIRAGPNAYKGVLYNILAFIIPIWLCSYRKNRRVEQSSVFLDAEQELKVGNSL